MNGESIGRMSKAASCRYARMSAICSSVTSLRTSSSFSSRPAMMPAAAAAAMPCIEPVCGTTTLLTFLMIFPLTSIRTRYGRLPSTARACAAA